MMSRDPPILSAITNASLNEPASMIFLFPTLAPLSIVDHSNFGLPSNSPSRPPPIIIASLGSARPII